MTQLFFLDFHALGACRVQFQGSFEALALLASYTGRMIFKMYTRKTAF